MKILVLGGGISGLSVAYHLLGRTTDPSIEVHVLEKDTLTGGLCRTLKKDGFRFDLGPHNFHSRMPEFHQAMKGLLGERYAERSFNAKVVFRGRTIPYPMSGVDVLKSIPLHTSAACAASFLAGLFSGRGKNEEEVSFRDFITKRFGAKMYEIYFGPFTEKVWGVPGSDLSADFGRERIGTYNLWDLFKSVFIGMRQKSSSTAENPFAEIKRFYPPSGCGELPDALLKQCTSDPRFHLHTGVEVTGLQQEDGRVTGVRTDQGEVSADHCFSTIPLPQLGGFLGLDDTGLLSYTATSFLILFLDRPSVMEESPWMLFSDASVPFSRVSELGLICEEMSPEGKTSLILEFTSRRRSEIDTGSDEDLFEAGVSGLQRSGLIERENVIGWTLVSRRGTHPLRRVGYAAEREKYLAAVEDMEGIETLGRQGTFAHMNMDKCFRSSEEAAIRFAEMNGLQ